MCNNAYQSCVTTVLNGASPAKDKSLVIMQRDGVIRRLIENTSGFLSSGTEYITDAVKTDFKQYTNGTTGPDVVWRFNASSLTPKATFDGNPTNYYRKIGTFLRYDNVNNIAQRAMESNISSSFLWDYNGEYPVAEAVNAAVDDIAYTSFEADGTGNWNVSSSQVNIIDARTGKQSYNLPNGSISKSGLTAGKKYTFSFWAKTGASVTLNGTTVTASASPPINGWLYYETSLTGITAATVAGTATIDELRCFPADAQMTTYTYEPLRGVTSQTDANNRTTYFDYDALGRLTATKDDQGKILKTYKYNYKQ
jgi:YD repeat-containing protein